MRTRLASVLVLSLLPGAAPAAAPAAPAPRRWRVERLGFTFELTSADLRAWKGERPHPPAFSMQALLDAERKSNEQDADERAAELLQPDAPEFATYELTSETSLALLSVVGPLVSYQRTSGGYSPGAAHPYAVSMIEVQDVTRPKVTPSLLDYFPEAALVQAMNADPWIRKFRDEQGRSSSAKTVKGLVEFLKAAAAPEGDDSCATDAYFDEDMVHHFAFHHREAGRVAVRVGILYGSEVCRGTLHQVGLVLPAPPALQEDLVRAERLEAGFFMKDRTALGSPTYSATFSADLKERAAKLSKSGRR